MTVASLALELASAGHSVICVEADLHHPQLCEYLHQRRPDRGLTDVLAGVHSIDDVVFALPAVMGASTNGHRTQTVNGHAAEGGTPGTVSLLTVGRRTARGADLLTLPRVEGFVQAMRERADYILVDTPSLLSSGDAFPFARASDNVIVVAREDRTTREAAEAAAATLDRLAIDRVSVVLLRPTSHARSWS